MTSFIIVGNDQESVATKLHDLLKPFTIHLFDITKIKRDVDEKTDKVKLSLGIADVKKMQQKAFLKPFQSKSKAIILEEAELLTTEAQNALLKILEEPPEHTLIVLLTNNLEALLPTIRSRCRIIQVDSPKQIMSDEEKKEFQAMVESLPHWGIGECLNKAEELAKNKKDALLWLEKSIITARAEMIKQTNKQSDYAQLIRKFQQTHTTLSKTNANPRLQLESLLLSLKQ